MKIIVVTKSNTPIFYFSFLVTRYLQQKIDLLILGCVAHHNIINFVPNHS